MTPNRQTTERFFKVRILFLLMEKRRILPIFGAGEDRRQMVRSVFLCFKAFYLMAYAPPAVEGHVATGEGLEQMNGKAFNSSSGVRWKRLSAETSDRVKLKNDKVFRLPAIRK